MMRVTVIGAAGRMGRMLIREVVAAKDLQLVGACEAKGSPALGQDAGSVAGISLLNVLVVADLTSSLENAQVVIDFTLPELTIKLAPICADKGRAMVIGTTGLSSEQAKMVEKAAKQIPIVWAPNMSIGVNVMLKLVGQTAKLLGPEYDLEIVEAHHKHKRDAPSGTALRIAEVLAQATKERGSLEERVCHGRVGQIGERDSNQIGIHSIRGGDIVGAHRVMYCADGERLELVHSASSRQIFAKGAIKALRWIADKKPGLYDMRDVLGL
ncbi:MAG: 4-hydroxy-tetrahydrodipicolinate reductase [Pseudomonadota bacterium]